MDEYSQNSNYSNYQQGLVRDVMPYLIRRSEENTSVLSQSNRELKLIAENKSVEKSR
jgi:hypothetical protein